MKVIGIADAPRWNQHYICTVSLDELKKFLGLYYSRDGKMTELKIGEEIDLGKGFDYASQIEDAMTKTRNLVQSNQAVVTAILNGLNIEAVAKAAESARLAQQQASNAVPHEEVKQA